MATIESEVFGEVVRLERFYGGPTGPSGNSQSIRDVCRLISQVAAHESNVLVLGESGTGKEVVARAIHEASPRRNRPFIAVNCGAIPSELLESELFGHEKGAFTGAVATRKGRFELAEGGTLFLDEIGDMSLPMQVKLLRVLQERVFERVGSALQYRCNVRIIAATHRNLEEAIRIGAFREDLFYRLNVFPIDMPALRTRSEDLPLLVREFSQLNVNSGRSPVVLSEAAQRCLNEYAWPGNVRELGNLIERLSILNNGRRVVPADLPPRYRPADWSERELEIVSTPQADDLAGNPTAVAATLSEREALLLLEDAPVAASSSGTLLPPAGIDLRAHVAAIEEGLIRQALARAGGTVAHAARLLGLRRTTLVEKLRKFGISAADDASET
jgi:sigma-54 dependent transcriptional regulator, flagellar regulatory protein